MVSTTTTSKMAVPSQQQQPQEKQQQQQPAKPKVKEKKSAAAAAAHSNAAGAKGDKNVVDRQPPDPLELEMARQDLFKVANPDTQTPFRSLEDACDRLLPYHVLGKYELDETEELGGEIVSKARTREESLKKKTKEFFTTFEKQVNLYNSILKKQLEGEMRGEERMMIEQSLLVEEKQKLATVRAQIEAKEKEEKEAAETKAKEALAQAEKARAEAQARAEAKARAEAAQAEAKSKAEALRAEAESMASVDSIQARLNGNSNAGTASEPMKMTGVSGNVADGGWAQLDEDDDEDEDEDDEDDEEDDDLEGVWDEDGEDDDDDEDDSGDTEMMTDYENTPSKPS